MYSSAAQPVASRHTTYEMPAYYVSTIGATQQQPAYDLLSPSTQYQELTDCVPEDTPEGTQSFVYDSILTN